MKTFLFYSSLFLFVTVLTGCNDAKYDVIEHAIYFTDAEYSSAKTVMIEPTGGEVPITVRSVSKSNKEITATCKVIPETLIRYNEKNGAEFTLLPESAYELPEKFVIKNGEFISGVEKIRIKAFTKEMINSGNKYALPLSLTSDGDILTASSTLILTLDQIIETSVIALRSKADGDKQVSGPFVQLPLAAPLELDTWSFEFRFKKNRMNHTAGQYFLSASDGGQEISFAIGAGKRFWMRNNGAETASNQLMVADKWYHVAVVADGTLISIYINGELDKTMSDPSGKQKIRNRMGLGFSNMVAGETFLFSELRLWSTARTQSQIQFNMYGISPKSEGLIGYWKFNEGAGNEFKNHADEIVPNAYLASVLGDPPTPFEGEAEWVHGVRSDEK